MRWANDLASGQLVTAAKAIHGRTYRCPKCNARVRLRSGIERSAHFAHQAGEGKPDCEDYYPTISDHILGPTFEPPNPPTTRLIKAVASPLLCIELEPDSKWRPGLGRRWGLRLLLPKSDDSHGKIRLDDGSDKPVLVPMSDLSLGPRPIILNPDGKDFGTHWLSPEVRPAYKEAISRRTDGLSRSLINVFTTSSQKYKPRSNELFWGNSYYFVWHSACPSRPPSSIIRHSLSDTAAWQCSLIVLPQEPDDAIRQWILGSCVPPLSPERRLWAIAYPPPYGLDVDGFIQVPPTEMMLVGVMIPSGKSASSKLQYNSPQGTSDIHFTTDGKHLVKCQVHDGASFHKFLWNEIPLASIRNLSGRNDPVRGVCISYVLRSGAERRESELHTVQGQNALRLVRSSSADLVAVSLPCSTSGSLQWRSDLSGQAGLLDLPGTNHDPTNQSLKQVLIGQINSVLQDKALEVRLRFNAFGEFYADAETQVQHRTSKALSDNLRARIMWLLACTPPMSSSTSKTLPDEDLIRRLKSSYFPRHLLSHKRSIERDIDLTSGGSNGR